MNNFKIAIISPGYPSEKSGGFGFVHSRAKLYLKENCVKVFTIGGNEVERKFEGIDIVEGSSGFLYQKITNFKPDVLAIHFPVYSIINLVKKLNYPKVVWIHGHEIIFSFKISGKAKNLIDYIKKRLFLIPRQFYQMLLLRSFLPKVDRVVFVSNWMKEIAENSVLRKFNNYNIIPNPVDTNLFKYYGPNLNNINNTVSIRSMHNNKYGIDIAIKAFANKKDISLDVYGQGKLYEKYKALVEKTVSNTKLNHISLNHNQIPELLSKYSVFIAPSRVEAQGVSMCEAMACGLPIVATKIGGIPEFVRDGVDGYLVANENPQELFLAIKRILEDKEKLVQMGKNARENIFNVCSGDVICKKEIDLLNSVIKD